MEYKFLVWIVPENDYNRLYGQFIDGTPSVMTQLMIHRGRFNIA